MDNDLKNIYKCIRCGYCLPTCPTYAITGLEYSVARGRNYFAKAIIERETDFSKKVKQSIFECLLCGACVENCAPAVKTNEIMVTARAAYIQKYGQPPLQRYLFRELLPYPERMTRLMKLLALGKRSGISGLVKALRVFGWFGKNIAETEGLFKTFPKTFLRQLLPTFPFKDGHKSLKVAYFIGCGINYAFPDVGLATVQLLAKSKVRLKVLNNYCCGLPAAGYGDIEAARMLAQKNLLIMKNIDCDLFITDCASCTSFLKDYPILFKDNSEWSELARSLSHKIIDITEFFDRFYIEKRLKLNKKITVTYHDPCHLSHYLHISSQPRNLINQIDGVNFHELPEADWCCGGAGTYNISHHELSMKILQRKMQNLQSTGAQVLVTACPGCLVQLSYGVRKYKLPVKVNHLNQLFLLALQN